MRPAPLGVRFLGVYVNADQTVAEAAEQFRAAGLPFPAVHDEGNRLAPPAGDRDAGSVPH